MGANVINRPTAEAAPRRRRARAVALAATAVAALSACTSLPGPSRVAQDIVKTEAAANPDLDEDCLLGKLADFSDDDLNSISEKVRSSSADVQAEGQAELEAFRAALETCM